jgi:hypothetical protein
VAKRVPRHQPNNQDPGFKAARAWFFDNETNREKREEALALRMARLLRIDPNVLYGKIGYIQQNLDALEQQADAEGWSDEMCKIERRRQIRFAVEHFRQIPWVVQAIRAARHDRELPMHVSAELPAALTKVRKDYPNAEPQKGLVVHEIKCQLTEKHGLRVSKERIARALSPDFASRD